MSNGVFYFNGVFVWLVLFLWKFVVFFFPEAGERVLNASIAAYCH